MIKVNIGIECFYTCWTLVEDIKNNLNNNNNHIFWPSYRTGSVCWIQLPSAKCLRTDMRVSVWNICWRQCEYYWSVVNYFWLVNDLTYHAYRLAIHSEVIGLNRYPRRLFTGWKEQCSISLAYRAHKNIFFSLVNIIQPSHPYILTGCNYTCTIIHLRNGSGSGEILHNLLAGM